MEIKSKRYFEVNYLFMKPFSQSFEVLTQRSDVINPKLDQKRTQIRISCTYDDRKVKIKNKRDLRGEIFIYETVFSKS